MYVVMYTYTYIYIMNEEVKRIAEDFQRSVKQRIDALLEMDANMYTNLGSDSTEEEKLEVKKKSRVIYTAIRVMDEEIGKPLLQHQDGFE